MGRLEKGGVVGGDEFGKVEIGVMLKIWRLWKQQS